MVLLIVLTVMIMITYWCNKVLAFCTVDADDDGDNDDNVDDNDYADNDDANDDNDDDNDADYADNGDDDNYWCNEVLAFGTSRDKLLFVTLVAVQPVLPA